MMIFPFGECSDDGLGCLRYLEIDGLWIDSGSIGSDASHRSFASLTHHPIWIWIEDVGVFEDLNYCGMD